MRILLDRRQWLQLGLFSSLGGRALAAAESTRRLNAPGFGKAKSVLFVYTSGGMSQIDSWDPKPNAPAEIRGAFKSIPTAVRGIRFCEHMPKTAAIADRLTILRSMSHDDLDHGSATYVALSGVFHQRKSSNPPITPNDYPTYGAVLKRVRPHRDFPHTAVHLNGPVHAPILHAPGQFGGFLGRKFEPLILGDVASKSDLLEGLEPQVELSSARLESRRALWEQFDAASRGSEHSQVSRQAFELLQSSGHRKAFDLESESERTRDRYGRHRAGQACLMARRLIEAGVPWVTVFFNHKIRGQDDSIAADEYGWDTHNDIFDSLKDQLLPRFDWSFSALMEDLHVRGLLATTLVVCVGEFGRAPNVAFEKNFAGSSPGRKHWAAVYSAALAGAGIVPGAAYGSSDRFGAYPQANPVTPGDLAATMFHALGVDPGSHYEDAAGRIFPVATGRPVTGLFS